MESSAGVTTAVSLVRSPERSASFDKICKTWIFAIGKSQLLTDRDFDYFSSNVHDVEQETLKARVILFIENETNFDKITIDHEYKFEDIVYSTYFGVFKFTPHCQVVFIVANKIPSFQDISKLLISKKFSRTHKDYMLLIGYSNYAPSLFNSPIVEDFRYKYFLEVNNNNSLLEAIDFCNPNPYGNLKLFDRSCNSILNGKQLQVTSVLGTPYIRFQNNPDGSLRWGAGIYYDLIHDSSKRFNYTFRVFGANSGGSSGFKRDGKWYGAMGDVFLRRAHFAIGAGISDHRDTVIETAVPLEWNTRIFFVRSPPLKTSWKAIFWPFSIVVWVLIVLIAILIVPTYYLSFQKLKNTSFTASKTNISILGDVVRCLVMILLEQAISARNWMGFRIRMLIMMWMLFCLVMGAGYRSRLINFLTFIVPDTVPTTHSELIAERYTLYFRFYGGIAYRHAANSKDPVMQVLIERAILVNTSQECIVLAALTENSACLDWEFHGDYATFTNATPHVHSTGQLIVKSKDGVMNILIAWVFRKMSPLIETFDRYLMQTFCSGLYNYWLNNDWTKSKVEGARWMKQEKSHVNKKLLAFFKDFSSNPKPLAFSSLYGLFSLSGTCLFVAFIVWILEMYQCFGKRSKALLRKQKSTQNPVVNAVTKGTEYLKQNVIKIIYN